MNEKEQKLMTQLFYENEIRTNRLASGALMILGVLVCILAGLDFFNLYHLGGNWVRRGVFISGLMCIVLHPISAHFQYKEKWIKRMIMGMVVASSAISFFLFPFNANFLTYGPIVISAVYYNPKLIKKASITSWVLYAILLWANCFLERVSPVFQEFHSFLDITIFREPLEVFVDHFLPHTMFFIIITLACNRIATQGWELLNKQAKITEEVNSMERDLSAATEMQIHSLPNHTFSTDDGNILIKAFMRPAKAVGGDFYDYFEKDNNLVFLVADVSDKGLPAAMFMMKAKDAIRAAFQTESTFEEAVQTANSLLCKDNVENMFITLWVACIDVKSGVGKYANCGHVPPIIKHKNGTVERITNNPDLMMGVFEDAKYTCHPIRVSKGDTFVIFTDGLTDAVNKDGKCFGEERVIDAVRNLSAEEIDTSDYLIQQVDEFVGDTEQFDDMTSIRVHFFKTRKPLHKEFTISVGNAQTEQLMDAVNEMLKKNACPEDIRRNIDVTIDEVCENINEYAYDEGVGNYLVSVDAGTNYIRLTYTDDGVEFNPLTEDAEPDDLQVGGLGIYLCKNIMDKISYERKDNKNVLNMMKIWNM